MKIFLILSFLLCSRLSAENWTEYWAKGLEESDNGKYFEAEQDLNMAIRELELHGNNDHFHVYVDRGKIYILLEKYSDALADLDKALQSNTLEYNDHIQALVSRIRARFELGMEKGVLEDLKQFGAIYHEIPKIEETEKHIVIRNMPDCECVQNMITCYFIHAGVCRSKSDIRMLKSRTCIIDKPLKVPFNEKEDIETDRCDNCGKSFKEGLQFSVEGCNSWCDANAIIASGWCGRVFKRPDCATACLAAVYMVQKGCYWCCSEGNFYKKCIEPFGSVVDFMDKPCQPYKD